eukprot:Tamp_13337.p3 GENE.Tamp_13337~~Tamp_13337.p3  ORF type:complete len:134 (-),score=30.12 Tamp_13337:1012-1413(-)
MASAPEKQESRKAFWALLGAALAVCALCGVVIMSNQPASAELMEVRLPNGEFARLVPVQALRQRRMTKLFGPGDLPIPIEDDGMPGGDARVVPGSNVHLFEHMAPPQPYGMDNRRDPPYDTSFHGMGFGSDGR